MDTTIVKDYYVPDGELVEFYTSNELIQLDSYRYINPKELQYPLKIVEAFGVD